MLTDLRHSPVNGGILVEAIGIYTFNRGDLVGSDSGFARTGTMAAHV